jgi:hypothetical protein
MLKINNRKISYIIFSPERKELSKIENNLLCDKAASILYSKDYNVIPVKGYFKGDLENSFVALQNTENNDILRKDCLFLLDTFNQESAIVKYFGETDATKILNSGEEKQMGIAIYNLDSENKTYLYDGISFSFLEKKKYYYPREKNELRNGMILEYFDNKEWSSKEIIDINIEYENLYKLLMRYNKIRIPVN